jgi:hypothetical protein
MNYEWTTSTVLDIESKSYGSSKARRSSRDHPEDPMVVQASTDHNIIVVKLCSAQSLKLV